MTYDLIVIGAGPGGFMAAIEAARRGFSVLVLEKNDRPGKKLLATGSGQCNLTNDLPMQTFLKHYHEKSRVAEKSIRQFPPEALIKWFETAGVQMEKTASGKVFPVSRKATDVLGALLMQAKASKVSLICGMRVTGISENREVGFTVKTTGQPFWGRRVLIATGGCTYPSLGTTGDGYVFAARLGHNIIPPRHALAAVHIHNYCLADLAGLSISEANITLWRDQKKRAVFNGDLLLTHTGLSGPVILNYARYFRPSDILTLNLAVPLNEESYQAEFMETLGVSGKRLVRTAMTLKREIPKRLTDRLMAQAGVSESTTCAQLSKEERKRIINFMTRWPFPIDRVAGPEEAMATAGGIDTDEIDARTMESRKVQGLYFVGEVIDVDGMTGGFNLQFAFSSGYAAAHALR